MATIVIPENVKQIMQKLLDNGFEAWIVGGFVRDSILGHQPHDADIFTNATGTQILQIFPQGKVIGGEERQAKILTVVVDNVEVSQYRSSGDRTQTGKSLKRHLTTCDFNINSIALDINGNIVDPNQGQDALRNGWFCYVGNPQDRIKEDPLRILRAIRFNLKLQNEFIHYGTFKEYGHLIETLPKERIRDEFMRILGYDGGVEKLISTGLIKYVLPKLLENHGVNGGQHHNETVLEHLLYAFNTAKKITDNNLIWLTALLHDIAKAECYSETDVALLTNPPQYVKEIHFFAHEDVGASFVKKWMTEYKFATHEIQFVTTLIKNHMWQFSETYNKRSFINHFKEFEDNGVGILDFVALKYCDHQGNQANPRIKYADFVKHSPLPRKYYELKFSKEPFKVSDLVVKGQDLIDRGYKPGPKMGEILRELFEKVMDGELTNERHVLLNYLKNHD